MILEHILAEEVRRLITNDKIRPDGRAVNEIRPLSSRIDIFERTHGSALFTRGQTQSLSVVTLGSLTEFQIIDGLGVEDSKRFMLHYNFPQLLLVQQEDMVVLVVVKLVMVLLAKELYYK